MTPVYRIELDDALVRVRNNNLNLNKPLAEKLAVVSGLCVFASLPLLMILGWGGYVWPLMVIGLFSGVSAFLLFKSILPGGENRYALLVFTQPTAIRQIESSEREPQYRLFLDGRQLPVSRSIWQAMPQTGEVAVFMTEEDEKVFHITRASWVDRSRLELLKPDGGVTVSSGKLKVVAEKNSVSEKKVKAKTSAVQNKKLSDSGKNIRSKATGQSQTSPRNQKKQDKKV